MSPSVAQRLVASLFDNALHKAGSRARLVLVFFLPAVFPVSAEQDTLRLLVIAPDTSHIAWESAQQLARYDPETLHINTLLASTPDSQNARVEPDILLMPLRSLASQVPALELLELPFFYRDIDEVHRVIDGEPGQMLKQKARQSDWEIIAFLDEGMQVMSGNRRYNDRINLTGMQFIELRPDPMAEKQLLAFDAWTQIISPDSQQEFLQQCRVGSRTTTLQRLWSERLDRVHLALSLSRHRYEGWVLVAPEARWRQLPAKIRERLATLAADLTQWQRSAAQQREEQALVELRKTGMTVHLFSAEQRQGFIDRLPLWQDLLSDRIPLAERQALIAAATARLSLPSGE